MQLFFLIQNYSTYNNARYFPTLKYSNIIISQNVLTFGQSAFKLVLPVQYYLVKRVQIIVNVLHNFMCWSESIRDNHTDKFSTGKI